MIAASSRRSMPFESTARKTGPPLHPPRSAFGGIRLGEIDSDLSISKTIPTFLSDALATFPAKQANMKSTLPGFSWRYIAGYPCRSPKLYLACIFNHFLRPPAAHSDDATLRL